MQGTVKFFNVTKGFGFITDESNQDHFIHISNIPSGEALEEGQVVSFEIREGRNGKMEAYDVTTGSAGVEGNVEINDGSDDDMSDDDAE